MANVRLPRKSSGIKQSAKSAIIVVYYKNMKILIATSSGEIAGELRAILEAESHVCIVSADGKKVVEDLYNNTPDMIMLDSALSHPSVSEVLLRIKSAPSTWDIPVLIIAAKRSMSRIAKCYELGAYDYLLRPFFREEILSRMRNMGYVSEKMKEVEKLLVRDYLTGLYNRKFFMERFTEELAWAARYMEPLSFIILDIDHFKKINDTHGHSCGDVVLKQLAEVLSGLLRAHDVLARYGGEEFVILLSNTNTEDAYAIGEKLRSGVQSTDFRCDKNILKLPVTISVGVATAADICLLEAESLINRADEALYRAKAEGRNRVVSAAAGWQESRDEG
jgi:two-component system, cell cycle response regulator